MNKEQAKALKQVFNAQYELFKRTNNSKALKAFGEFLETTLRINGEWN